MLSVLAEKKDIFNVFILQFHHTLSSKTLRGIGIIPQRFTESKIVVYPTLICVKRHHFCILSYQGLRFAILSLSKGRYDKTFAGEDAISVILKAESQKQPVSVLQENNTLLQMKWSKFELTLKIIKFPVYTCV